MRLRGVVIGLVIGVAAVAAPLVVQPAAGQPAQAQPTTQRQSQPFLWGVAASGYQSEGSAPDSNWRRYERNHASDVKEPYRNSVDFRHRYAEDIRNAARMGVKVFRFGIEWARIEPRQGVVDQSALRFYDDVVAKIRAAGMRPMITLDHWVYPGWAADKGAWAWPGMVDAWLTNARRVVGRYRDANALWITVNEPTAYLLKELSNGGLSGVLEATMLSRLVTVHRRAYDMIHSLIPGAKVSSNAAYTPAAEDALDTQFVDRVADKLDFLGVDYYYGLSPDDLSVLTAAQGEFWNITPQPDGIYYALRHYANRYPRLPLYVVENGMPTDNGKPRSDGYTRSQHLRDHIYWLQRAKADGIDVIGYNYWSITDNYEWGSYRPRFGLYTVDALTDPKLTRRPTDAVATYRSIIANGGVSKGYRPVKKAKICSLVDGLNSCLFPARDPGPIGSLR